MRHAFRPQQRDAIGTHVRRHVASKRGTRKESVSVMTVKLIREHRHNGFVDTCNCE